MKSRSEKLIKNTFILSIGTICTKVIMFLMIPLFTRWLTQSDYGIFDLIITYITLLVPIITLSCGEAVFRFLLEKKDEKAEKIIITNAFVISGIGFFISAIITGVLIFLNNNIINLAIYFLILLILEALNTLFTMILRGIKKLNIYVIANIIFVIAMVISVTIFVKLLDFKLEGMLLGYITGYIISILFMIKNTNIVKFLLLKNFDKQVAKDMLKYSVPLILNSLSWWIVNVSDRTIVTLFLGASSNAILAVANKVPNLCQTIFNVFHLSWQENASETINDADKDKYYTEVMNNMIVVLTSICIVILSSNFILFNYIFTLDYFDAYYQVPILIVSIIISMLAQFLGGIYIAKKESHKNGRTTVIAAIVNIIIHLILIKFIGIYAATISTLFSYAVLFIIRYIDIKKSIAIKFNRSAYRILCIFIYFMITNYINNLYLNIFNVLLAILLFIYINRKFIKSLVNKFI